MKLKALSILFVLLQPFFAMSSDSGRIKKFSFNVSGALYSQQVSLKGGESATNILLPSYLHNRRRDEALLASVWGLDKGLEATDNPMGHGASFLRMHCKGPLLDQLTLEASLEVNNGGFSWGPYNTDNIHILPRFLLNYQEQIRFAARDWKVSAKAGNFEQFRLFEGLSIYNMDLQGYDFSLESGKFSFSNVAIADLQKSVGLNIDGTRTWMLGLDSIKAVGFYHTLKFGFTKFMGNFTGKQSLDLSYCLSKGKFKLYGQLAGRFFEAQDVTESSAALAGIRFSKRNAGYLFDLSCEYRYFSDGYNRSFKNEAAVHYRKTDRGVGSNFAGEQIYPISFNNRPFSQWAVYTEYDQKLYVSGLGIVLKAERLIVGHCKFFADLDMNLIMAEAESAFVYPFYKTGLKFESVKGSWLSLAVTNRTLNYDKHYTTYYALKYPSIQAEFRRDLSL